jgi:serine/threonine-protein kinase
MIQCTVHHAGAGVVVWFAFEQPDAAPPSVIAVLPFKPLLRGERDEALELGMADALIARLSSSRALVVRPLGSVRRFTELDVDPLAAGRTLGVEAVLDGSIVRADARLRVTARLLRVHDGSTIWVGQLDEPFADVFEAQDTIATQLANTLVPELTVAESARLSRRDTEDPNAYRAYLLGRYHWARLTPSEIRKSIDYFRRAIAADPGYALAYAGLAEAYRALPITSDVPPLDMLPQGQSNAVRALELDPGLDGALATLCFIRFWLHHDWRAAEDACRAAIEINPHGADGYRAYAVLLSDRGRHAEAIAAARRATELDPLALLTHAIEAHVLHYAGRDDEALATTQRALDLQADFWIAQLIRGKAFLRHRRYDEALAAFESARANSGDNSETVSMIGFARALSGDRVGAERILEELLDRSRSTYVPPFNVAMVHNGLGRTSDALDWLEKAEGDRDVRLTFLAIEWKWNRLREERRFVALMHRLDLDGYPAPVMSIPTGPD